MRILVVSDIHANWPALQAIQEPYDACLFLGDLVDYGVTPVPCVDWVRKHATYAVRGNHDHGAVQRVDIVGTAGYRYLTSLTRPLNCELLSEDDRLFLSRLPLTSTFVLDGKRFFLVHATPRDPMDEYAPSDPELWIRRLEGLDTDFLCVGHTHQPFILRIGKTTVLNPGSVGLPRDGDPRASYAIITDGQVELKRVEYPVDQIIAAVEATELPAQAKKMLADGYQAGKLVRPEKES